MSGKYKIFEAGVYSDREKQILQEVADRVASVQCNVKQPPFSIGEYEIADTNRRWEDENPLYNDRDYATKAGYSSIPAYPSTVAPMMFGAGHKIPQDIADRFYYTMTYGDIRFYKSVTAGDGYYVMKLDDGEFNDITKTGDDIRIFEHNSLVGLFDENDELVLTMCDAFRDGYRYIIDGSQPPSFSDGIAEWIEYFPEGHYTTDEDWEYIFSLWDKEVIRGSEPLYWEDVKVGDEPAWHCSGPITCMDMVRYYPNTPNIKRMVRDKRMRDTMFRDKRGNYYFDTGIHYSNRNIDGAPMVFFNDTAAMHCARLVTNYIGDQGFMTRFYWIFKPFFKEMQVQRDGAEFLDKVPYMKGRGCEKHGSDGDTAICKGYVTDKYVDEKGDHIIDLTVWAENLDGQIIQVCGFSAKLPSKGE